MTDEPLFEVPKVVFECPPQWLVRVATRPLARLIWIFLAARRHNAGILMGYHIMPNALMCLVVGSMLSAKAVYQMTGGPIQVVGGGCGSENTLLKRLGRHSQLLEAMLFHLLRQFDQIVVRGSGARDFVNDHRLSSQCHIVTGSVDTTRFREAEGPAEYDVVYVSRLVPRYKGLEMLMDVLRELAGIHPGIRVAIVGDGPMREDLEEQAESLREQCRIDFLGQLGDVSGILRRSRLFVLVSPSEGMSISLLEALAAGLPAVVRDVGDLRDMVVSGDTGVLLANADPALAANEISSLLEDEPRRRRMAAAARQRAVSNCSVEAIADKWTRILGDGE